MNLPIKVFLIITNNATETASRAVTNDEGSTLRRNSCMSVPLSAMITPLDRGTSAVSRQSAAIWRSVVRVRWSGVAPLGRISWPANIAAKHGDFPCRWARLRSCRPLPLNRLIAQAFQPASSGAFLGSRTTDGMERPSNPQSGKTALQTGAGSSPRCALLEPWKPSLNPAAAGVRLNSKVEFGMRMAELSPQFLHLHRCAVRSLRV